MPGDSESSIGGSTYYSDNDSDGFDGEEEGEEELVPTPLGPDAGVYCL